MQERKLALDKKERVTTIPRFPNFPSAPSLLKRGLPLQGARDALRPHPRVACSQAPGSRLRTSQPGCSTSTPTSRRFP